MSSPHPRSRPENLGRGTPFGAAGSAAAPLPLASLPESRALCNEPEILGERLEPIPGPVTGCGIAQPVRVAAVAGLALSQPATLNCPTARALKSWIERGVEPAIGRLGGGATRLEIAAHYDCRPRNRQEGARISEHGRGRAIDISGIRLKDGTVLTVLQGWHDPEHGRILRALHTAACGLFGTVLGPGSDGYHADHLHFDTATYRRGSYCR